MRAGWTFRRMVWHCVAAMLLVGLAAPLRSAPAVPTQAAAGTLGGGTVLYIATERLTDLALGYRHFVQVAQLGFGTADKPWHAWFGGGVEMRPLVHLPGYRSGTPVRLAAPMLIGNRFGGRRWETGFAALASFDRDGNGIVEGEELRELYVWVDFDGDGSLAHREDALRPASFYYTAFDLRRAAVHKTGHARDGRLMAFSVLVPYTSRIHLLELDVSASFPSRHAGYLAHAATPAPLPGTAMPAPAPGAAQQAPPPAAASRRRVPDGTEPPINGQWRWKVTNADTWKDNTRPFGKEASGQLLLAADGERLLGVVRLVGPHEDRINLPLEGRWRDGRAQWTSVSPLGLTRSEVRLESRYGYPLLRGRSWSQRNGRVQEWTWEARHEKPLD